MYVRREVCPSLCLSLFSFRRRQLRYFYHLAVVVDRPFWRTIATAGGSGLWLNASRHDDDDDDDDDDDA